MIEAVSSLEQKISTANQITAHSKRGGIIWSSQLETKMKNERAVSSIMSAYTEEDRKIGLAIWRFLNADSKPSTAKTVASKLNLEAHVVDLMIDQLIKLGCIEEVDTTNGRAVYRAIIPK